MSRRKLRPADYHVAWIAPVSDLELLPSRLMLDEEHEAPDYDIAYDDNIYNCGTLAGHNVVIATCPPGMTGNVNAGRVTGSMFKTFTNLRMAVLVGIGGGIPRAHESDDPTENVHLGDVVVGWPGDGGPACIYYDFGRWHPGGQLEALGTIDKPDRILLNALAKVVSDHEMDQSTFQDHQQRLLQSKHRRKFMHPGLDRDQLFRADHQHSGHYNDRCVGCNTAELVDRPARSEEEANTFIFHRGRIATGNAVVQDGIRRDQIRDQCSGALCVEMEAAGVDAGRPCLVIRGISDYADSHKSDAWRSFAAGNAAVFARELLSKIPLSKITALDTTKFVVPYPSNPNFVGRLDILRLLKDKLGHGQPTHGTSYQRVSLFGLGGVGKTQIALAYVYWLRQTNPAISILWVHASNADRFHQSYMSIAEEYQIPGHVDPKNDLLLVVKNWLETKDSELWLMVLDNADDMQLFFWRTIITTARNLSAYLPENKQLGVRLAKGQRPVEVTQMDDNESVQLLRTKLDDTGTASTDLSLLASRLEYLPLALAQAASFMQETCITVLAYLQLLGDSDKNMVHFLSKEFETDGRDSPAPRAVAQTWILSFQQIKQQHGLASELLSFTSLLDRQEIPAEFLSSYNKREESEEPLDNTDIALTEALGVLKAFSFVVENNNRSYDMHRLVQLVTRKWLISCGTVSQFGKEALLVVSHLYPYGTYETRTTCAAYLSHANSVLRLSDHPDTLTIMANLASTYRDQGRWEEAEKLFVQVMETRKTKLGEDHPSTLTSMANLASTYRNQGRWDEAEKLEVQVMDISKTKLGVDHPDTLTSMANLASTYRNQGRWDEAEKLEVQVMDISKTKLGADHPSALTSMGNLALIYRNQGRWDEAEKLFVQVMETRKTKLGEDHPDTLTSMGNLALTFWNQGRWEEAEKFEVQVMETRKATLGVDHPSTLTSMNNLAYTLHGMGRVEEAINLMQTCIRIRQDKLGADHPDTRSSISTLENWT
ncbi:kinesin light chain [Stachybotrys elegans]|uniref:Kinesin light chain n=1 Tax=Stachybotrys elegans TaxID=80388 RepID=A0A8K0WKG5_9HYPO|nr:kinesin light chain [Stachybotrys elegans]